MSEFATESGHWYKLDGSPCYTMPNKSKGGERPTTLRDARKLNLVPSVTTIMQVAAKPALERWKREQLLLAALTLPPVEGESLSEYEKRIRQDAEEQAKEAREEGTRIHGAIESRYQGTGYDPKYSDIVDAVDDCLINAFGVQAWQAEKSFARHGFGGKVDLYSNEVIVDYKTKDFTREDLNKSFSYDENIMQLSAYRKGLNLPNAMIANLYISRTEPGLVKLEVHGEDYWDRFECLLKYWYLSKNMPLPE